MLRNVLLVSTKAVSLLADENCRHTIYLPEHLIV